jgi:hypothetical protein
MEDMGSDEDEGAMSDMMDEDDAEANKLKRKKKPTKGCEKFIKHGRCPEREKYIKYTNAV